MNKPAWFSLIEADQPMPVKPKTYKAFTLLVGILIGVMGTYFLIPQKVEDTPIDQISIVEPIQTKEPSTIINTPVAPVIKNPTIKNPMLNPSDDDDEDHDDD